MSSDILRRAAAKLRGTATTATTGAWFAGGQFHPWEVCISPKKPLVELDSVRGAADAEYIALMHPPVALALADWLDVAATELSNAWPHWVANLGGEAAAIAYAERLDAFGAALRVAFAVLREDGEQR